MLLFPTMVGAQVIGQNQLIQAPFGGFVFSPDGSPASKLQATSTPFFSTFNFGTANGTTICIAGDCRTAWPSGGSGFSTTSANYWASVTNLFSTTSTAYFLSQNQGNAFSTTSANYWKTQTSFSSASTTLLGDNNTFSGTNVFNNTISGSISGNAGTATKLATARAINNINFDGTAAITITAASSTLLGDSNTFSGIDLFTNSSSNFSGTWQTFAPSHFQVAGNYITALTGDVTASGPNSVAATLATVNASPGTYTNATLTVNGKGLVTSASSGSASAASSTLLGDNNTFSGSDKFSSVLTASGGELTVGSSTEVGNATTTGNQSVGSLNVNGDWLSDITGSGLAIVSHALAVSGLSTTNFSSASISQWTNDAGYVTSSFSTTSAAYWQSVNNFFSTTSASYFLAQNQGNAFSTTSANYWKTQTIFTGASTTLLADNNTFSGNDTFSNTVTGSVTGNAGTATKLATARAINGVNFDGTGPITIFAASSTLLTDNNALSGLNSFTNTGTTTFGGGINLVNGQCFAIKGVCLVSGSGSQNLFGVLTTGNDAGGVAITDAGAITGTVLNATSTTATSTYTNAVQIGSVSSNAKLEVSGSATTSASVTTGGLANVSLSNDGAGMVVTKNGSAVDTGRTFVVDQTGVNDSQDAVMMTSASPSATILNIQSFATGKGGIKCEQKTTGGDANASCISIDIGSGGGGTSAMGIFMDATNGGTLGKLLNLRNNGTEYFTLDHLGNFGLSSSTPGSIFAIGTSGGINFTSNATTTYGTAVNGINISKGCFSIGGVCIGGSSGTGASTTLLSDSNTFSGVNVFNGNTTFGKATSSSFAITSIASHLLKTDASGDVIPAIAGTDYLNSLAGAVTNIVTPQGNNSGNVTFATTSQTTNGQTIGLNIVGGVNITFNPTISGTLSLAGGGTNSTTFSPNSIVTSNAAGTSLIATSSFLTVSSITASSTTATNAIGGALFNGAAPVAGLGTSNSQLVISQSINNLARQLDLANINMGAQAEGGITFENGNSTNAGASSAYIGGLVFGGPNFNTAGFSGLAPNGLALFNTDGPVAIGAISSNSASSSLSFYAGNNSSFAGGQPDMILSGGTANLGIATVTPTARLAVQGLAGGTIPLMLVSSSTSGFATSTAFVIDKNGNVGIGTTSPNGILGIQGVANFTFATTSFSSTGGINIAKGCFSIAGTCLSTGGAGITAITGPTGLSFSGSPTSVATLASGFSIRKTVSFTVGASGADFTTIQAALNACGTQGGGTVLLTDHSYAIGGTGLTFTGSNCILTGLGMGTTTITFTGATTAIKTNSAAGQYTNDEIHNIFFSGDGTAGSVAIDWSNMTHGVVSNVQTSDVGTSLVLNDTQNITFYNSFSDLNFNDNHQFCINASSTDPVNGNYFNNIFCGDAATSNVVGLQLDNSNGNTFNNIYLEPGSLTGTVGIKLFDNKLATNNGVFNNTFSNFYIEANATGVSIATSINASGGGIQRNTLTNITSEANTTDWSVTPAAALVNTINGYDSNFGQPLNLIQGPVGIGTSTELQAIAKTPFATFAVDAVNANTTNEVAIANSSNRTDLIVNNSGFLGLATTTFSTQFSDAGSGMFYESASNAQIPLTIVNDTSVATQDTLRVQDNNNFAYSGTLVDLIVKNTSDSGSVLNITNPGKGLSINVANGTTSTPHLALTALRTITNANAVCQLTTGNEVVTAGNTTCITSSEYTKHDIQDISQSTAMEIMDLQPVQYVMNDGGDARYGFIAENVNKVDSKLVEDAQATTTIDGHQYNVGDPLSVDYERYTGLLTAFVQYQQHEIENIQIGKVTRSAEENWQDVFIGLLLLYVGYNEWDKRRK